MKIFIWLFGLIMMLSAAGHAHSHSLADDQLDPLPILNEVASISTLARENTQAPDNTEKSPDKQSWWQNRTLKDDLYYPHKVHNEVMTRSGDSCFLCHSFSKNTVTNKNQLKALNQIANEPLLAICHSCHVDQRTASSDCNICHSDKTSIWPEDHNFDYLKHHRLDAENNSQSCQSCHLDLNFCTDCHFNHNTPGNNHPPGYIGRHGVDVMRNTGECASCHLPDFCSDCHRGRR